MTNRSRWIVRAALAAGFWTGAAAGEFVQTPLPAARAEQYTPYALICEESYNTEFSPVGDYHAYDKTAVNTLAVTFNPREQDQKYGLNSGFRCSYVVNEKTKELVLVFRGTDDLMGDGRTDLEVFARTQAYLRQMELAKEAAGVAQQIAAKRGYKLVMTGHSLGGALATYAATTVSGATAITFNAPPLVGDYRVEAGASVGARGQTMEDVIKNVRMSDDGVSGVDLQHYPPQGKTYVIEASGRSPGFWGWVKHRLAGSHGIKDVLGGLERAREAGVPGEVEPDETAEAGVDYEVVDQRLQAQTERERRRLQEEGEDGESSEPGRAEGEDAGPGAPARERTELDDLDQRLDLVDADIKAIEADLAEEDDADRQADIRKRLEAARRRQQELQGRRLRLAERATQDESGSLFDAVSKLYENAGRAWTGGRTALDSFVEAWDEDGERRSSQAVAAWDTQIDEREAGVANQRIRNDMDADRQAAAAGYAMSMLAANAESAMAEAQWKRNNSWGAWLQSLALNTLGGAASGFGSGFGYRVGSGLVEHELDSRYGGGHRDTLGSAAGPGSSRPGGKKVSSPFSGDKSKHGDKDDDGHQSSTAEKSPEPVRSSVGSSGASSSASTSPVKPPTTASQPTPSSPPPASPAPGSVLRTIDGKPFQGPPDGRNTSNEIDPSLAKPGQ